MPNIEWLRPEFEGREELLETQAESAKRTGVSLSMMRAYVRRYTGVFPEAALLINGRLAYRPAEEIDAFLVWLKTRETTRTPGEVAKAEVARIETALKKAHHSVDKYTAKAEAAQREVTRLRGALKEAEEKSALLNRE